MNDTADRPARTIRRVLRSVGCLALLMLSYGGTIAWADYSVAGSDHAGPIGIVTAGSLLTGLVLLTSMIRARRRRGRTATSGQ